MEFETYKSGDEKKSLQERLDRLEKGRVAEANELPTITMSSAVSEALPGIAEQPEEEQEVPEESPVEESNLYNEDGSLKPLSERLAHIPGVSVVGQEATQTGVDGERKLTAQEKVDRAEAKYEAEREAEREVTRADEKDEGFWGTVSSMFTGEDETEYNREYKGTFGEDYRSSVLAETSQGSYSLETGEYTQNDLYRNDEAFSKVFKYMEQRYGLSSVEGLSREEIVDRFLNNRRGVTSGNSIRSLSELQWSIKATDEDKAAARDAYELFDGMGNVFGGETTFAEKAEGLMDYTRSALMDPVNLLGFGKGITRLGQATGTRVLSSAAKSKALAEGARQTAKGASVEVAKQAARSVYQKELSKGTAIAAGRQASFVAEIVGKPAWNRLVNQRALLEVGQATITDATFQGIAEFMNQRTYLETEYQDAVDLSQVGLTMLFASAMGGVAAGAQLFKGGSKASLVPSAKVGQTKSIFKNLTDNIQKARKSGTGIKLADDVWGTDLDLGAIDGTRFTQMVMGVADKDGNVKFEGLIGLLAKEGLYYSKDKGTVTEWVTELIGELDDDTAQGLAKAIGVRNPGLITATEFADVVKTKVTQGSRHMGSMSAIARQSGKLVEDVTPKDTVHAFFNSTPSKPGDTPSGFKKAAEVAKRSQDSMIRALVTHPGTTFRNVVGYVGVTGVNMANDLTNSLLFATRGSLGKVYDTVSGVTNPASDMYLRKAKHTFLGVRDQIGFVFDPYMTKTSFDSHTIHFAKEMEGLSHIRAGGIDTGAGLDLDSAFSMSFNSRLDQTSRRVNLANIFTQQNETIGDTLQSLAMVTAQDDWSKSLSFTAELNKQIRSRFDMDMKSFYNSPDVTALMASKGYKEALADSILKAQDETLSRSYKGTGELGKIAGIIEDARSLPVIGAAVPFGRFFNNTLGFLHKNSTQPAWNVLVDTATKGSPKVEDISRLAVTGALIYKYADDAETALDKGLGMFQKEDKETGDTKDVTFDYPFSMFRAVGFVLARAARGETLSENEIDQLFGEAFGGSVVDSPVRLFQALGRDMTKAAEDGGGLAGLKDITMGEFVKLLGVQYISAFTRVADPYNVVIKAVGKGEGQKDKEQYERKFLANSLRYVDTFVPEALFGGSSELDYKAAEGGQQVSTVGRVFGTTNVTLTSTQRVMNMVGVKSWQYEAEKKSREYAPRLANEMNRLLGVELEERSSRLMGNPRFRNASREDKEVLWKMEVEKAKDDAKLELQYQAGERSYVNGIVYNLVAGYSRKDLSEGLSVIGVAEESRVEDLTDDQVLALEDWLQVSGKVKKLEASAVLNR